MIAVILASTLATLCLATFVRAQEVFQGSFVAFGDRYRVSAVNSSLMLGPEVPFGPRKRARALPEDEKLSRCDEFVALALRSRGLPGPGGVPLVRDRVEPRPEDRSWVLYAQRHQGYRILGAGGRIELDAYGRVLFAGLSYETEKLRNFRPMDSSALKKLAASAVPHPRVGLPISQELMIDPLGDAPAQLRAYVVYQVQAHERVEGWQVILDAETGKVLDSFSLFMNAESPRGGRSLRASGVRAASG
jgi:hypothetical protein